MSTIQEVNAHLLRLGYTVDSGSPAAVIYSKSKGRRRRILRVSIDGTTVIGIVLEVHTPNPTEAWSPRVTKRKISVDKVLHSKELAVSVEQVVTRLLETAAQVSIKSSR